MNEEGDGIGFIQKILNEYPDAKILVFSFRTNPNIILSAYQHGAMGYVTKGADPEELIAAINRIVAGEKYYMPGIAETIIESGLVFRKDVDPSNALTPEEHKNILFHSLMKSQSLMRGSSQTEKDHPEYQEATPKVCIAHSG